MNSAQALAVLGFVVAGGAASEATELRDPTRPPVAVAPAAHVPKPAALPCVSAIFVSAARRVAIFDGEPVHAGDNVGPYTIETITATGVHYRLKQQTAFAPLKTVPDHPPTPERNP